MRGDLPHATPPTHTAKPPVMPNGPITFCNHPFKLRQRNSTMLLFGILARSRGHLARVSSVRGGHVPTRATPTLMDMLGIGMT